MALGVFGIVEVVLVVRRVLGLLNDEIAETRAVHFRIELSGELARDALGDVTGAINTDDVLDRVFRDFCIGK